MTQQTQEQIAEILEELHFKCGLPIGFVNDGKPHKAYSHATDDGCIDQATKLLNEIVREGRIKAERSGMAFVHATVLGLTDDKKLLNRLDKIVQAELDHLKALKREESSDE